MDRLTEMSSHVREAIVLLNLERLNHARRRSSTVDAKLARTRQYLSELQNEIQGYRLAVVYLKRHWMIDDDEIREQGVNRL